MREANTTPAPVRDSDQALDIVRRYSGRVDWQGEGKEKMKKRNEFCGMIYSTQRLPIH